MSLQEENWDIGRTFWIRNAKLSYQGTENVAIYAFSSGKFLNVRKLAHVKDLTNIMSEEIHNLWSVSPSHLPTCPLWQTTSPLSFLSNFFLLFSLSLQLHTKPAVNKFVPKNFLFFIKWQLDQLIIFAGNHRLNLKEN